MAKIPEILGLPPSTYVSNGLIENSMPIATIHPGYPEFVMGMSLFQLSLDKGRTAYLELLKNHDIEVPNINNGLKVAYIADSFPTDTFTNEYGESFLGRFGEAASEGLSQISQMTGSTDVSQLIGQMTDKARSGSAGMNPMMRQMGEMLGSGGDWLKEFQNSAAGGGAGGAVKGMAQLASKVLTGQRVDFPMVWKNSGFSPSYTMTVRLYNPKPASETATDKYIISPLGAILCLCLPISDDGATFSWPLFCKVETKGIYNLNPAVITNVAVVKGGDQQQVAFNQRLGIVDVRIDFASLFSSLVAGKNKLPTNRPTLAGYLDSLRDKESINKMTYKSGEDVTNYTLTPPKIQPTTTNQRLSGESVDLSEPARVRVVDNRTSISNSLIANGNYPPTRPV